MRWFVVALLVVHGLVHFMGVAKAFGELPRLTLPITRPVGALWALAAVLTLASAILLAVDARWFWVVGAGAAVLSQVVIVLSWQDAKFGTLANVVGLLAVAYGFASQGPPSMRQAYREETRAALARAPRADLLTEGDLKALPEPVRNYIRRSGAIGRPQVVDFRATWRGRIRGGAADPWMTFRAEQVNVYEVDEPSRLFLMDATMKHLPVDVFHRFVGGAATFRVRVLSVFPMVDAKGPEMDRAETVTLFNDLALLAPGRLIDRSIVWEPVDAHRARARFTRGVETIAAELVFDDAGDLVDFVSDDRTAASPDGKTFTAQRWRTPVSAYRSFGARRVMTRGTADWEPATGRFTYLELDLERIEYNTSVTSPPRAADPSRS